MEKLNYNQQGSFCMKYEVRLGDSFKKAFKRLWKKYRALDDDLEGLITQLEENPEIGANLGNGIRKVRMSISSKGKGKSHGARVITHTVVISTSEGIVTLLSIYDKAEKNTITKNEIHQLLQELNLSPSDL